VIVIAGDTVLPSHVPECYFLLITASGKAVRYLMISMYLSLLGARTIDLTKGLQPNWAVQLCRNSCQRGEGEERGQISNQEKEKISSWILMLLKGQKTLLSGILLSLEFNPCFLVPCQRSLFPSFSLAVTRIQFWTFGCFAASTLVGVDGTLTLLTVPDCPLIGKKTLYLIYEFTKLHRIHFCLHLQ